jgi:predicted ester cyclase
MSVDDHKRQVRRLIEDAMNRGKLDLLDELMAPDMVEHEALGPGIPPTREGVKLFFAGLQQAFPDMQGTIEDEIAEGDKLVARVTMRGTHTGSFMGIAPTGKRVEMEVIDICRFADGRLVEHWGLSDALGLLQQLGAVPAPGGGS